MLLLIPHHEDYEDYTVVNSKLLCFRHCHDIAGATLKTFCDFVFLYAIMIILSLCSRALFETRDTLPPIPNLACRRPISAHVRCSCPRPHFPASGTAREGE